ncbi:unnamed protein product, partial [Sphacelaria rigidula]
ERFWQINSSYFPEDHREGWFRKLIDLPELLPRDNDPAYNVPALGAPRAWEEIIKNMGPPPDEDNDDKKKPKDGKGKAKAKAKAPAPAPAPASTSTRTTRSSRTCTQAGSDEPPPPPPPPPRPPQPLQPSAFKAAECHRQVSIAVHKHDQPRRAGLHYALRIADTPEQREALEAERANGGPEWTAYEPLSQRVLDELFPTRPPPAAPPVQRTDGYIVQPGVVANVPYGSAPLPLRLGRLSPAAQ